MDFIAGAINDVFDKTERDDTAKFDELTGVTHQQGAEIAKQLCLIRAELPGMRMAIVEAAAAVRSKRGAGAAAGRANVVFVTVHTFV